MATEQEVTAAAAVQLADSFGTISDRLGDVPSTEIVREVPDDALRITGGLNAVLSNDQKIQFELLLDEIRELNNRFVGMRTVEATVQLLLLDEAMDLMDRVETWFSDFINMRVAKVNPKDDGNPFKRYDRLACEFHEIFAHGVRLEEPNTISHIFLNEPSRRSHFVMFSDCFSSYISPIYGRSTWTAAAIHNGPAFVRELAFRYQHFAHRTHCHLNLFFPFLECVTMARTIRLGVELRRPCETPTVREETQRIAKDIRYLRQFLSGSRRDELILDIGGFFVGLVWELRFGIAVLRIGPTRDDLVRQLLSDMAVPESLPMANIRRDGCLSDKNCPWVTSDHWNHADNALVVMVLLESIYNLLFESFSKIEFDDVRQKSLDGEIESGYEDQALAVSLLDLESYESNHAPITTANFDIANNLGGTESPPNDRAKPKNLQLRKTRQSTLLRFLEQFFQCKVSAGKGSEINVFRNDGFWKLGRHKQDREISVGKLKEGLRALKISFYEWYACVSSLRRLKSLS